jgi:hypothetical protein
MTELGFGRDATDARRWMASGILSSCARRREADAATPSLPLPYHRLQAR